MEEEIKANSPEHIKLAKNTKGYVWELRVLGNDLITEHEIKRLEDLNNLMKSKFGEGVKKD